MGDLSSDRLNAPGDKACKIDPGLIIIVSEKDITRARRNTATGTVGAAER